nr:MAG TPA: hypothetical protein [Caudoviricetes sp.]
MFSILFSIFRRERRDMIEADDVRQIYALYTDLWKLFREYHGAQTDEEWEKLQARAEEIVKQYGTDSRSLVLETIILIERKGKKHGKNDR